MIPTLKQHSNGYYYVHWMDGRRTKRLTTKHKDELRAAVFLGNFILDEWAHQVFKRTMYSSEPVNQSKGALTDGREKIQTSCDIIQLSSAKRRAARN